MKTRQKTVAKVGMLILPMASLAGLAYAIEDGSGADCGLDEHSAWMSVCLHLLDDRPWKPASEEARRDPWSIPYTPPFTFSDPDLASAFSAACLELLEDPERIPTRRLQSIHPGNIEALASCPWKEHVEWLDRCVVDTIRLEGAKRKEVEERFRYNGGIGHPRSREMFHKDCRRLMIRPRFKLVEPHERSPNDVIKRYESMLCQACAVSD